MLIQHIEIANFRKLLASRLDLAEKTTVFVGANNSGKTSAMLALRRFLVGRQNQFSTHDITLCHWSAIDAIGEAWVGAQANNLPADISMEAWTPYLPAVDLWLSVAPQELHHVSKLLPTLDWTGGLLGIRLRLEPDDIEELRREFLEATFAADAIRATEAAENDKSDDKKPPKLRLWPEGIMDFLSRRMSRHMKVRAYALDPGKLVPPEKDMARPQILPPDSPVIDDPLRGLIRINEINAQRGFGESPPQEDGVDDASGHAPARLSEQLRGYYQKHLDPSEHPEVDDLAALRAMEAAEESFNKRLAASFKPAFDEVSGLGYPGVTDPKPIIATRLRPVDGLNHQSAVTFEIDVVPGDGGDPVPVLRLPENNNGLGYQNLISMIFRLMSFRDAWMRVGKAAKSPNASEFEPLHLVLVEEPEAHLHAQVQQVFIKKAYGVLRAHPDLGDKKELRTQMLVSTHSSHVTHETPYSCLRYFRRLPAGMNAIPIPVSVVINLTEAFGETNETTRFVTRYLRTQHADLFFADALILVEGPAERMLVPHFIERHYKIAHQGYITLLEVGGSHAHRLKPLVEKLGLTTLVITDLDAQSKEIVPADGDKPEKVKWHAAQPKLGEGQTTNNDTLKSWWPKKATVDELLEKDLEKTLFGDSLFSVRVAYQVPVEMIWPVDSAPQTALPYTFEDALAFENPAFFSLLPGPGLATKFREALAGSVDAQVIGEDLFKALRNGDKAEFALNILDSEKFDDLKVPGYIATGLAWLETQIKKKQVDVLSTETVPQNG